MQKRFKPMTDNLHTQKKQQERDMAVTGTKREFQMMPVSFVAKADTGGVIVTETSACWREMDSR